MQVSWIDPDEVRELLRQLEGPQKGASGSAWELNTLPRNPVRPTPVEPLMSEGYPPVPSKAAHPPVEHPVAEPRHGPASAELWRIRERLRALREKAQTAGMLSRTGTDEPLPEPDVPPQAEPVEPATGPLPEPENATVPTEPVTEVVASSPDLVEAPPEPVTIIPAPAAPTVEEERNPELETPVPHPTPSSTATSPGFEPLFGTAAPLAAGLEPTPDAASAPPNEPTLESAPAPAANDTFVVPALGLSDRLHAVAAWVCQRLGTHEVLLVDDYGDVLWGAQGHTALVLSAMMAWHSTQRASAVAACIDPDRIDKSLAGDRVLTVLPVRTRYGVVSLAAIQAQPISDANATAIRRALTLAVEGPVGPQFDDGA